MLYVSSGFRLWDSDIQKQSSDKSICCLREDLKCRLSLISMVYIWPVEHVQVGSHIKCPCKLSRGGWIFDIPCNLFVLATTNESVLRWLSGRLQGLCKSLL